MSEDLNRLQIAVIERLIAESGMPWSERLRELALLEEGWRDGESGSRIHHSALFTAREVLKRFQESDRKLPGVFPLEDGGVQLEWASPRTITSLEISPDLAFSVFHLVIASRFSEDSDTRDFGQALRFLQRVVE